MDKHCKYCETFDNYNQTFNFIQCIDGEYKDVKVYLSNHEAGNYSLVIDGFDFYCRDKYKLLPCLWENIIMTNNKLYLKINFHKLAKEHGVRQGYIFYSKTFNSWVLEGHPDIDLILIDPPFQKGQMLTGLKGEAQKFNGKLVKNVVIENNMWCFTLEV